LKKKSSEKKLPLKANSGMVTIVSIILKSKSLLRERMTISTKEPEKSQKWHRIEIKNEPLELP
jgi:hypothetical protein